MRQIIISFLLFSLVIISCKGQTNENKKCFNSNIKNKIEPKIDIKVNKEYDDKGNLIRYDSTYSYFYSNIENDSLLKDSIFNNFKTFFNQEYQFSNDPFFNELFFQDSLLQYDFYNHDFFFDRFKKNQLHINQLFRQMDSLKNYFFNQQFPKLMKEK
jgi:hypothetical protein